MKSAKSDDDLGDLHARLGAEGDTKAAASIHFQFQVDRLALRHAFLATRLARAGDRVRMRISTDHVTLAAQNKTMRCEADVRFSETSRVVVDQAIVVETQADLFANFLCNRRLWDGSQKAHGKTITFFAVDVPPANSGGGEPLQPGHWQIKSGYLDIDWPFAYVGTEEISETAHTGILVRTDQIARALAFVYKFSGHGHSAPQFGQVQVQSSQASAGSPASARVVTVPHLPVGVDGLPCFLAGVDLRVARENAADLIDVLREFDQFATQMWVTEVEQGFVGASHRCAVARAPEGPNFGRLYNDVPVELAIAPACDFDDSMCKIMSQLRSDTDIVRLALSSEEEEKLRFSVAVNGGTAVVTCPVRRVRIEKDEVPSETRELWLTGDALANTVALPRADEIELHLFEHHVLFKQEDDGLTTAETFVLAQKAPRPLPSSER